MEGGMAFSPFVDAYAYSSTFEEFKRSLFLNASEWGEHSVGIQVLQGKKPLKVGNKFILAIGIWENTRYALITTKDVHEEHEVVQHNWPSEANVT